MLFLGDSFTLGWGLREDETMLAHVQQWLNQRPEPWEVINAAYHAGVSPDAYYAYLKREGLALVPDAIVVIIYTGNDIEDLQDNVWTLVDDAGAPEALYTIRAYADYQGRMMNPKLLPWYYGLPPLSESRVFLNLAGAATRAVSGLRVPGSGRLGRPLDEAEAWRRFVIVGRATARLARSHAIPLAYVALARPGTHKSQDRHFEPVRRLFEEELGLPFLALHDLLNANHAIPNDGHLNAQGASIAASAIECFLADTILSPKSGAGDNAPRSKPGNSGRGDRC
jgi:lysophospholipase L1-like esterase